MLQTTTIPAILAIPRVTRSGPSGRKSGVQRDPAGEAIKRIQAFLTAAPDGRMTVYGRDIQYSGGPGTWPVFQAEVRRENRVLAKKALRQGLEYQPESWTLLEEDAPAGWEAASIEIFEEQDEGYILGIRSECVVVFDLESFRPVGFVAYQLRANSKIAGRMDPEGDGRYSEKAAKTLDYKVKVDLIYLLPRYRGRIGFSGALRQGPVDRVSRSLVTGYGTLGYPQQFRKVEEVYQKRRKAPAFRHGDISRTHLAACCKIP